jgi:hypothetical protein
MFLKNSQDLKNLTTEPKSGTFLVVFKVTELHGSLTVGGVNHAKITNDSISSKVCGKRQPE